MKEKKNEKQKRIALNKNDVTIAEYRQLTGETESETSDEEVHKKLDELKIFCGAIITTFLRNLKEIGKTS